MRVRGWVHPANLSKAGSTSFSAPEARHRRSRNKWASLAWLYDERRGLWVSHLWRFIPGSITFQRKNRCIVCDILLIQINKLQENYYQNTVTTSCILIKLIRILWKTEENKNQINFKYRSNLLTKMEVKSVQINVNIIFMKYKYIKLMLMSACVLNPWALVSILYITPPKNVRMFGHIRGFSFIRNVFFVINIRDDVPFWDLNA